MTQQILDVRQMPVCIIVWTQSGCPACAEYLPTFRKVADKYQHCIPIIIADVERFPGAADHYRVQSLPTTVISRYGQRSFRHIEGAADEHTIDGLFYSATRGQCVIQ